MSAQHPRIRTALSLKIGRLNLISIVGVYLAITLVSAAILAALMQAVDARSRGFSHLFRATLSAVFSPGDLLTADGESPAFYTIAAFATLLGVLLPIFMLGAFVFKLFQQEPLTWRKIVSIESRYNEPPVLVFRFYNSSTSDLVNTKIVVIARILSTGEPRTITNIRLPVLLERAGKLVDEASWPYSRSGVPFSIRVQLGDGLSARETVDKGLLCLPGRDEAVECSRVAFLLVASGQVLESGSSFLSAREYAAGKDMVYGHFQEINAYAGEDPKSWHGWSNFDGNVEMFVFGYGSLVSPTSVSSTLGHEIDGKNFHYAMLRGWKRVWNVGSDKTSHPERTFHFADGSEFNGLTVALGIVECAEDHSCNGTIFPANRADLTLLDVRERNYTRIEVTDRVTWAGKPVNCIVYTYAPTDVALNRVHEAESKGRCIVVRKSYVDLVKKAFDEIHMLDVYEETTPLPPYEIADISTTIDPKLAPALVRSLKSSYFEEPAERVLPPQRSSSDGNDA
jgi:cation transport regulator ChaC